MRISIPTELEGVKNCFREANTPIYLVGGSVRNALLGLERSDVDICGPMLPQDVMQLLSGTEFTVVPIALDFGTVQIHIPLENGKSLVTEYTTFRSDQYEVGGMHRPTSVVFSDSLEKDAFRRDFSVNALYASLEDGEVIDPTGGIEDIEKRLLRCSSKDPDDIMQDDALRTLRLIRFAAELGFSIEEKTWESAKRYASQLRDVAAERIWQEMRKILLADVRYGAKTETGEGAHQRALFQMLELGMLDIIFPELLEGRDIEQSKEYHAYPVLEHNIRSCGFSQPILTVRLASLLHDVGKPRALAENGRFLGHDKIGADMSIKMLERMRIDKRTIQTVSELIAVHMLDLNNNAKVSTLRKHFARMGTELALEFADVREADFLGSGLQSPPVVSAERYRNIVAQMQNDGTPFSSNEIQLTGGEISEITGYPPGPMIGEIKYRLWMHCAARPLDNRPQRLAKLAHNIAASLLHNPPKQDRAEYTAKQHKK